MSAEPEPRRHGRRRALVRLAQRKRPGALPGTVTADPSAAATRISAMWYGPESCEESDGLAVAEVGALRAGAPVLWLDVAGLADVGEIEKIGAEFGLHRLSLEDVVSIHQRPKAELFEDHVFIVLRMAVPGHGSDTEQVSIFVGRGYVLTFQERPGDCFDAVRDRLRRGKGRLRQLGADYLAYSLIDAVIDGYFPVLEDLGETLESLEDEVIARPQEGQVDRLHSIKRELLSLRRAVWPTREMVNALVRDETPVFEATTRIYLRDCYDHAIQLMDIVETYREIASGLLDVYLSSLSARMNEIMKVLTIIATIFIPLSFVTGLFGMNFDTSSPWNMPELGWRFGYLYALGLMAATALGLLYAFRRWGWIGRRGGP